MLSPHERRAARVLLAVIALVPLLFLTSRAYQSLYSWIETSTVRELSLEKRHTHRLANGAVIEFDIHHVITGGTPQRTFKIWVAFLTTDPERTARYVEGLGGFTSEIPVEMHLVDGELTLGTQRFSVSEGRFFAVNLDTNIVRQADSEPRRDVVEAFRAAFPEETFSPPPPR